MGHNTRHHRNPHNLNLRTDMKSSEQYVMKNRTPSTSAWLVGVTWMVVLAATFLTGSVARASNTYNWIAGTDVYNNPAAWDQNAVPSTTNDFAFVADSGTVNYNAGMTYALGQLSIGGAFGSGTLDRKSTR